MKGQKYQFLIVFNLPKWVDKYIVQLKDEFADEFGSYPSRRSKPHVTIARGLRKDVFEEAKEVYLSRRYRSSSMKSKLKVLRREVIDERTLGNYEEVCDLTLGGM